MVNGRHPHSTPPPLMDQYRRAFRMLAEQRDSIAAMELLSQCVAEDPGNLIFVETYLAALKHRVRPPGPFRGVLLRIGCLRAIEQEDWDKVLMQGPGLILLRPMDARVFLGLALACQHRSFQEIALRYWAVATDLLPNNVPVQKQAGIAFGEQGHFGQAVECWQRVLRRCPDDVRAKDLLKIYDRLRPVVATPVDATAASADVTIYLERAKQLATAGHPQQACQWIEQGLNVSPGEERLRDQLQDLNVQVAEQRYHVAQHQAECLKTSESEELVEKLEQDWRREELDVAFDRHHRWPGREDLRLRLASLLKRQQRFEEAVRLLHRPPEEMDGAWREQLELGECLQHLRRFEEAFSHYKLATQGAGPLTDQQAKLARFRAGSLALALGKVATAATILEELVALDDAFPDALQKLAEARRLIGNSANEPTSD